MLIRDFHLKRNRRFGCRRAYDITQEALRLIWPKPPVPKPRGMRKPFRVDGKEASP
jgi:hypothetical protein